MELHTLRTHGALCAFYCACFFGLVACVQAPVSSSGIGPLSPGGSSTPQSGNWGIDACLTAHVPPEGRGAYLQLLRGSGVVWLRERGPNPGMAELKTAGFRVVSFLGDLHAGQPRVGDALPEDLVAVFNGARALAKSDDARNIDAWEMIGEPDVGYCPDLPDRLAAFQKAVYLGLKAGARDSRTSRLSTLDLQLATTQAPLVLMGALALPPGPWLERAVKNGLLDYTDAYNFHFYGNAENLTGVIAAHRAVAKRVASGDRSQMADDVRNPSAVNRLFSSIRRLFSVVHLWSGKLPLWITECGIDAVPAGDYLNVARRELQVDFTIKTASQALAASRVAVFMPFILTHEKDPHAMTISASQSLPAWDAYAKFTREHPWPKRTLSASPKEANPIVVQWIPAVGAAVAHKVSGTYRFWERRPMHGEIRVYNFSNWAVQGRLRSAIPVEFRGVPASSSTSPIELIIPALGCVTLPVTFVAPLVGYARGECDFSFTDSSGDQTKTCFGLETWPETNDFTEGELELHPLSNRRIQFPEFPHYEPADVSGPWQTINGLHVASTDSGKGTVFWTDRPSIDPLMPAMAFAAVDGLPADGFLHLQMDRPMASGRTVRVDLVDTDGQRFCIWENLGQSYFINSPEVWLNVRDMQVYFWGRCTTNPAFHPERVKEIQLWFYRKNSGEKMQVQLSWMTPKPTSK